jgi:hypothetical protein
MYSEHFMVCESSSCQLFLMRHLNQFYWMSAFLITVVSHNSQFTVVISSHEWGQRGVTPPAGPGLGGP